MECNHEYKAPEFSTKDGYGCFYCTEDKLEAALLQVAELESLARQSGMGYYNLISNECPEIVAATPRLAVWALIKMAKAASLQVGELCAALERLIPIVRVLTMDSTEAADADNAEALVVKCRRLAVYDTEKPFHVEGQPGEVCGPCGVVHPVTEKRKCECGGDGNVVGCIPSCPAYVEKRVEEPLKGCIGRAYRPSGPGKCNLNDGHSGKCQ